MGVFFVFTPRREVKIHYLPEIGPKMNKMKKNILLTLLLSMSLSSFGQVQIGNDIDGENIEDLSGHSVALSANGNIVAIGAIENDDGGNRSGHVRVYENVAGTWAQIGQDIAGEAEDDRSGWSLAISASGAIVAIGSDLNDGNGNWSGHVRIYENLAGTWTQIGSDIDGEAAGDVSGTSISLSDNGEIVAIGAPRNDDNGDNTGHVRIFENTNGSWVQIGQDIDGQFLGERSGNAVALNGAGNIVVIGASQNDENGTNTGEVKIYENIGGTWTQLGGDINGMTPFETAGSAVAISESGNIVAVSSTSSDINGNNSGHVSVFENIDGIWTQIGQNINGEAAEDFSGWSVALSGSGDIIAIGAIQNDGGGVDAGQVRVYKNIGGAWQQVGNAINGEAAFDNSGFSLDISDDGSIVAIGAKTNSGFNGIFSGHVRVFDLSTPLSISKTKLEPSISLYPNPSNDIINITSKEYKIDRIELYSLTGALIFREDLNSHMFVLNISNYSFNSYLLKVFSGNYSSSTLIIKQ